MSLGENDLEKGVSLSFVYLGWFGVGLGLEACVVVRCDGWALGTLRTYSCSPAADVTAKKQKESMLGVCFLWNGATR